MAITIRDVARRAGVSPSTVSRALSGKGRMRPETRERIRKIARELGFRPNAHARGLATKVTQCVGVVIDARHVPLEGSFYGPVLEAIEATLDAEGYHVVFSVLRKHRIPKSVVEGRVDGVLLLGTDIGEDIVMPLKERVPVVLVDNHLPQVDAVVGDNVGGARLAVEHLISHGHRRIAFIAETLADLSFRERLAGYLQTMEERGMPLDEGLIAEGERGPWSVEKAMRKLLAQSPLPTAIFAANDHMAIGAMRFLEEKGHRVPEEVAVVGFDDGDLAPHVVPPLTTVRVSRGEMGKVAAKRLLELMRGEGAGAQLIVLSCELVRRRSCGCPK